jgi:hypothetical protein
MHIAPPKRKRNNYVSRVCSTDQHPVIIKITDAKVLNVHNTPSGDLVRVWIPHESAAFRELRQVDTACLDAVIANNEKWFSNDLTEQAIRDYFRESLNTVHNSFVAAIAEDREPVITLNGTVTHLDSLHKYPDIAYIEVEAQGLYFFETKCGVRWLLRKMVLNTHEDDIDPNKQEIEDQWRRDVDDLRKKVATNCRVYTETSHGFVEKAEAAYEMLQNCKTDREWNDKCQELAKIILDYNRFAQD